MTIDKKIKDLEFKIKDPKLKFKIKQLLLERKKFLEKKEIEKKEMERKNKLEEKKTAHNKYLPKYLSLKILNAIGFIEYTRRKGTLDMSKMTDFLMTEKKITKKEMGWILLLLSLETVEEILSTPEVGGMIKDAILRNKRTLH